MTPNQRKRYDALRQLAAHPETPANERVSAEARIAEMGKKYGGPPAGSSRRHSGKTTSGVSFTWEEPFSREDLFGAEFAEWFVRAGGFRSPPGPRNYDRNNYNPFVTGADDLIAKDHPLVMDVLGAILNGDHDNRCDDCRRKEAVRHSAKAPTPPKPEGAVFVNGVKIGDVTGWNISTDPTGILEMEMEMEMKNELPWIRWAGKPADSVRIQVSQMDSKGEGTNGTKVFFRMG